MSDRAPDTDTTHNGGVTAPVPREEAWRIWSSEDVYALLDSHRLWIDSDGARGSRANLAGRDLAELDLSNAELSGVDLRGANLRDTSLAGARLDQALLSHTNLRGVDLRGASLRHANLIRADLTGAKVRGADLRHSLLCDANLTAITGFQAGQLGGADLSGVTLPARIEDGPGVEIVEKASENSRTIFLVLLALCGYAGLTLAGTSDAELLSNSAGSSLPVLDTEVPVRSLFVVVPLLLLAVYLYFHLHLHGLWTAIAKLPACFPDGRRLDERTYPWLLTSMVQTTVPRLREEAPPLSKPKVVIAALFGWWLVPILVYLYWASYLALHEFWGTAAQIVLCTFAAGVGVGSYLLAGRILSAGAPRAPTSNHDRPRDPRSAVVAALLVVPSILGLISASAFLGVWWLPQIGPFLSPHLRLEPGVALSRLLPEWDSSSDTAGVVGADLSGWNLRRADLSGAFLVRADLTGADLRHARLVSARMMGARLERADLRGSILAGADLSYAVLDRVFAADPLVDPDSICSTVRDKGAIVDLSQAVLRRASLSGAELRCADLTQADLTGATVIEADLRGVGLPWLSSGLRADSATFRGSHLEHAYLKSAYLRCADFTNAHLQRAYLAEANLTDAKLADAQLQRAYLAGATLRRTNLGGAKLDGVRNWRQIENLHAANLTRVTGLPQSELEWAKQEKGAVDSYQDWRDSVPVLEERCPSREPGEARGAGSPP